MAGALAKQHIQQNIQGTVNTAAASASDAHGIKKFAYW